MIIFGDGEQLDALVHLGGTKCTIYTTEEPNTSGFSVDGFDCSDFTTLYRQGEGYYQLSNDGTVCQNEAEEVPTEEYVEKMHQEIEYSKEINNLKTAIEDKKQELASTDYIIIKQMEGLDMSEYDLDQIKNDRQILRNEINALEDELSAIAES